MMNAPRFPLLASRLIALALCVAGIACTVSDEQEVAIGERDAAEINTQLPLLDNPRITAYVQQLGQAIAAKTSRVQGLCRTKLITAPTQASPAAAGRICPAM
jgi:predicted Zn-dependent protease